MSYSRGDYFVRAGGWRHDAVRIWMKIRLGTACAAPSLMNQDYEVSRFYAIRGGR